ncbi:hypothetical protein HU200_016002 [Digitaria exilis]|uniref:Uncharacterized protein n=1 Tax=Digitaria exilis TaxID=1010633 RepID=A0A835F9E3_9POAL|nr:hypothetical protein HU200_016002 [Digitaria exilis]
MLKPLPTTLRRCSDTPLTARVAPRAAQHMAALGSGAPQSCTLRLSGPGPTTSATRRYIPPPSRGLIGARPIPPPPPSILLGPPPTIPYPNPNPNPHSIPSSPATELAVPSIPRRGKKRPPSPAAPPSDDVEDLPMSTTSDDGWKFGDSDSEEDEEENQGAA